MLAVSPLINGNDDGSGEFFALSSLSNNNELQKNCEFVTQNCKFATLANMVASGGQLSGPLAAGREEGRKGV